jgi:hypothetical protein
VAGGLLAGAAQAAGTPIDKDKANISLMMASAATAAFGQSNAVGLFNMSSMLKPCGFADDDITSVHLAIAAPFDRETTPKVVKLFEEKTAGKYKDYDRKAIDVAAESSLLAYTFAYSSAQGALMDRFMDKDSRTKACAKVKADLAKLFKDDAATLAIVKKYK